MNTNDIYDYIIESNITSEEALDLITSINGMNEETLNDVIYSKTGYRNIEQYLSSEDLKTYKDYYDTEEE